MDRLRKVRYDTTRTVLFRIQSGRKKTQQSKLTLKEAL
jgi:hypothetical protein